MSPQCPPSETSPAIPRPVSHLSSSPRPRRPAMTANPLNLSSYAPESRRNGEAPASQRNREGQNEKENWMTGDWGGGEGQDDMEKDGRRRGQGFLGRNLVNKPIEIKRVKKATEAPTTHQQPRHQASRSRLQIPDSTDSERDELLEAGVHSTRQSPKNGPDPTTTSKNRQQNLAEVETMSEEEEYEPPTRKLVKRKQDENHGGNDLSDDRERPRHRRKTASSPQRSRHSPDRMETDDEEVAAGGDDKGEEEDWDRRKQPAFTKREKRRNKAVAVKASTWIKAKEKEKKIKSNLICLSEEGPRDTWPEAWKSLADKCSDAIVQKIREITGTGVKQEWTEVPRLDDEGNPMMVIYFSAEAGMKDTRNVKFARRVVKLIREEEEEWPILTAAGRHYISDKYLMKKVFKAMNGFKRAWKAQTNEELAQTIADSAKANRMIGRQMTAAQNLQKGAKIFLEKWFPAKDAPNRKVEERAKKAMKIGKQIIAAEWMSETESGPDDAVDRREWLKEIGRETDARGKATSRYDVKEKGIAIFEVRPVTWRSELYQWYIDKCQEAFEKEHRIRIEERVYPNLARSKLSRFPAPKALVNSAVIEGVKVENCCDEQDVCNEWGKDEDEEVEWFMKRVAKLRRGIEDEGMQGVE